MSVKLTENRILIEVKEVEEKTASGIIIPNADSEENTAEGKVIDVGPGNTTESGNLIPIEVKVGERVLYIKDSGDKVVLDEKEFLIIKEDEILAIIDG